MAMIVNTHRRECGIIFYDFAEDRRGHTTPVQVRDAGPHQVGLVRLSASSSS